MKPTKQELAIVHDLLEGIISQREACRELEINRTTLATIILKVVRYERGNK